MEYAILTDEISRAWSNMSTRQYKNYKGLTRQGSKGMRGKRYLNGVKTACSTAGKKYGKTRINARAKAASFALVVLFVALLVVATSESWGFSFHPFHPASTEAWAQEAQAVRAAQVAQVAQAAEKPLALEPLAKVGDFEVEGPASAYSYAAPILTILTPDPLTISMASGAIIPTTDRIAIASDVNANLTLDDVSIDVSSIDAAVALEVEESASLELTLSGTNTLTSGSGRAGLQLDTSANLIITRDSGESSLAATGGGNKNVSAAGIGAGYSTGVAGNITIEGGTIIAKAGLDLSGTAYGAAGIGAGRTGSGVNNITITGGIIEAKGADYGAGIGAGSDNSGVAGTIAISGDNTIIEATSGSHGGAGIGGGRSSSVTGAIAISGSAIVNAIGNGNYGVGIGGGYDGSSVGSIDISGDTITEASSGPYCAGIGGGILNSGVTGSIKISGGSIEATGGTNSGSGIGGGYIYGSVGSITISGGSIKAIGGGTYGGAGIGGGYNISGVGSITISGGIIRASGGGALSSADIGDGEDVSSVASVVIDGGSVWATNGTITPAPRNSAGSLVFFNTLTLGSSDFPAEMLVTGGIVDGVECVDSVDVPVGVYGIRDVMVDSAGEVYFWLPATGSGGTEVGAVGLVADGLGYELAYPRAEESQEKTLLAAPALASVSPFGAGVVFAGEVVLTFSDTMRGAEATGATIKLVPETGTPITLSAGTWSSGNTVYTASYTGLVPSTVYTVEISGFKTLVSGLTLPSDNTHSFTTENSYAATITPSAYNFGTQEKGYTPLTHAFTITNTGTGTLDDLTVFLEGPDASAFAFTSTLAPLGLASSGLTPQATYSLAPGQHLTVEAHPVSGLTPRSASYTATLCVSASPDIDLAAPLTFTVKPSGGGGGGGTLPKSGDTTSLTLTLTALALAILGTTTIITTLSRRRKPTH
jgi:hypothetical protein